MNHIKRSEINFKIYMNLLLIIKIKGRQNKINFVSSNSYNSYKIFLVIYTFLIVLLFIKYIRVDDL